MNPEPKKFSAYAVRVGNVSSDLTIDGNVKGAGQVQVSTSYVRPSAHGAGSNGSTSPQGAAAYSVSDGLSQASTSTVNG